VQSLIAQWPARHSAEYAFRVINNHFLITSQHPLVMWIPPDAISTEVRLRSDAPLGCLPDLVGGEVGRKMVIVASRLEKFIRPDSGFAGEPTSLAENARLKKVRQFLDVYPHFSRSTWFREVEKELKRSGSGKYKHNTFRSREDLWEFFETEINGLVNSLSSHGYIDQLSHDRPRGVIWRDGMVSKSIHGNHRFFLAQLLQVPQIPIEVDAIHRHWWNKHMGGLPSRKKLTEVGLLFSKNVKVGKDV
jgi:hypothetical protein